MAVRSLYIPPVNTVPHGSQITVHSTSQHSTTWQIIVYSTSQHSTTWWSHHCTFLQSTQYHMAVRSLYIPPVNTVPHGNHITVHSSSQHSTTWQSDHCAFHQSTQYHMADHCTFHQSTQYHMVITSLYIPPVNTVLHHVHGSQITVHSTSQHSTTWQSDHCTLHSQCSTTWQSDWRLVKKR